VYKILVKKPEGKPKCRWDNIRMDLREIGWEVDWIYVPQDIDHWRAVVNSVMNLWLP
jgi:hypothetical protein